MDWPVIRPVLKTLIQNLSGLPESFTVWEDEPRPFGDILALLSTVSIAGKGQGDECRTAYDGTKPQGQELSDTWAGVRSFTLSIKVESDTQTDLTFAYFTLERVRDRLCFKSTTATLNSVLLAFIKAEPTLDLSEVRDDRRWSIATLDITLAARTITQDPIPYGYITTAPLTGTLTG